MATLTTPNMGLPYPDDNEYLKDVPDFIRVLALALDKGKLPSFANAAGRTAGIPSPTPGTICWITEAGNARLTLWDGSGWKRVYPTDPVIQSGSAAPSGSAEAGTIYIQY